MPSRGAFPKCWSLLKQVEKYSVACLGMLACIVKFVFSCLDLGVCIVVCNSIVTFSDGSVGWALIM